MTYPFGTLSSYALIHHFFISTSSYRLQVFKYNGEGPVAHVRIEQAFDAMWQVIIS